MEREAQRRVRRGRPGGAEHGREVVQRVRPEDRQVDDWHVDDRDDPEDRGARRATREVRGQPAERQVADVHHEHDRGGAEPRLPRPPHAPRGLRPYRPCDQKEAGEEHPDLGGGDRYRVEDGALRPEPAHRREEDDDEGEVREPRQRNVHVEDAVHVTLHRVGGCPEERHHARHDERRGGSDAEPRTDAQHRRAARKGGLHHSIAAGTMVRPKTEYTTANAKRSPAHESAPTASPLMAELGPREAATSCGTRTGNARIGTSAARARNRSASTTFTTTTGGSAITPSTTTTTRWNGSASGRSSSTSDRMPPTAATSARTMDSARTLPPKSASRPPGSATSPSSASSSSSRSKERIVARIVANASASQKSADATSASRATAGPTTRLSSSTRTVMNVTAATIPSGCRRSARSSRTATRPMRSRSLTRGSRSRGRSRCATRPDRRAPGARAWPRRRCA